MISWSVRIGAKRNPRQTSATCFSILVGLKFTPVDVILVGLDVRLPFLRQIFQRENGRHRTDRNTGTAVNALSGIDVQLRHFIEHRAAIVIGAAFRRMDTIHRAHIYTGGILRSDAGFGDDVGHRSPPSMNRISLQKAWVLLRITPSVNSENHPADPDSNPSDAAECQLYSPKRRMAGSSPSTERRSWQVLFQRSTW